MTLQSARQQLYAQLKKLYDEREAANITDWVMEHITGKKKIDWLINKQAVLSAALLTKLATITKELLAHRPVQYVLGEAWFAGMKFYVNETTLIPRPETEELVDWAWREVQYATFNIQNILDIGTGSGCIPIALKKKLPQVQVTSIDISRDALQVAAKNAADWQVEVSLLAVDFLQEAVWDQLPVVDIIVSNPPYIKQSESAGMAKHVVDFEPGIALFVPDEDTLIFYRKIAAFGKTHLTKQGSIFLEINEALGKEAVELYAQEGYRTELRKDLQGKDRMLRITFAN